MTLNIFVLLLFIILLSNVFGVSITTTQNMKNTMGNVLIEQFGLARGGKIHINYSINTTYVVNATYNDAIYYSNIVLLIVNQNEYNSWYIGAGNSNGVSYCNQPSLYRKQLLTNGNVTYDIDMEYGQPSQYSVILLRCRDYPSTTNNAQISVDLKVSAKNPRPYSSTSFSQLSIDEVMIPRVLEGEVIVYTFMLIGCLFQFYASRHWFRNIDILFTFTIFTQLLFTISQYAGTIV